MMERWNTGRMEQRGRGRSSILTIFVFNAISLLLLTAAAEAEEKMTILKAPVSDELNASVDKKTIKLRVDPVAGMESHAGWPCATDRGVFLGDGPGGRAARFSTGYAIYEGIYPAGAGTCFTVEFWLRPDEPDWGVWQEPWSSARNPENMFFLAKPMIVSVGTFLTSAWELRLCRNRLEINVGDWSAAGITRLKVGRWTHVAMVRDGDELSLYIDGKPETLVQPERVDGATGEILPRLAKPLPPLADARLRLHPGDGGARAGGFNVMIMGRPHERGNYGDQFIGAVGQLTLENRAWQAEEVVHVFNKNRKQAEELSLRFSVLSDPVGGCSRRADKQRESFEEYMERTEWFRKARYGLFMHWNPSSVAATEISWGRGTNPDQLDPEKYDALYMEFNPALFDPHQWATDAKGGGMRYMVWTAKHHDGFVMWDTKLSSYNIMASPWGKDIVRQYTDALREDGMRVGIYFSQRDWWWAADRPELTGNQQRKTDLVSYVEGQLTELCANYGRLDMLWFDGGVGNEAGMYTEIIGPKQPRAVTNDRNGPGDYATPEGHIPIRPVINPDGSDRIWESCIPMGNGGWSFHHDGADDYDLLIRQMVEIFAKGGNLLRNIGPRPTGDWSPRVRDRIRQIGKWLEVNGESVYGTHRTRIGRQPWGWATASSTTLYLHVLCWPDGELRMEGLNDSVASAHLLDGAAALAFKQEDDVLILRLPEEAPDPVNTVIAVSFHKPARSGEERR